MFERSWLDRFVRRFQDRWETNAQYRAAVTGVVGLGMVLLLCVCMLLVATTANSALASFGLTSSNNDANTQGSSGSRTLGGVATFPIATFPPFQTPAIPPVSTLPDSGTPPPAPTDTPIPTDTPTATPCTSNCGGGGGGPNPWVRGQTGNLIFHTSSPNVQIGLIYNIPGCVTNTVEPAGQTDGSGNGTISYQLQSCTATGTGSITIFALFPGGTLQTGTTVNCKS